MEASAKLNHQVTEVFSTIGEWWGPQESRGGGDGGGGESSLPLLLGSAFWRPGTRQNVSGGWKVSRIARGLDFMALGNRQGGRGPGTALRAGCMPGRGPPLPDHLPLSFTAQELLQREDRKKAQPQRGDAGLALKGAPAGQAGCCAH